MKKSLSFILSFVMIISTLFSVPLYAFADGETEGTCGDNATWEYNVSTKTLTISGTGAISDFGWDSPAPWNTFKDEIKTVNISQGITSTGTLSFRQLSVLVNVSLPNSLETIGRYSFSECSSLESLSIPNNVTYIRDYSFKECVALSSIIIPSSVKTIGDSAFKGCSVLTEVTLSSGLKKMKNAFVDCVALTNVFIPDTVTSIDGSFAGCINLSRIDVDGNNGVYSSIDGILYNKDKTEILLYPKNSEIVDYVVPDTITAINSYAFADYSKIKSIIIPNSVTSIGKFAFRDCVNLISVTLPNGIDCIEEYTFDGCKKLKSIEIPDSVTNIGDCAFMGCEELSNILLPNGLKTIGGSAFRQCRSLTQITIPASVESLGGAVFIFCDNLSRINVDENNSVYSSIDGILYNKEKTELILFPVKSDVTDIELPDTITNLPSEVFRGNTVIKRVKLPKGITTITDLMFDGCTSLSSVMIPDSITSIGMSAFSGCTSLSRITIPNSVTSFGYQAFEDCNKLVLIEYTGTKEQWNSYPEEFLNTYVIKNAVISCTDGFIYDESLYYVDNNAIYTADKSKLIMLLKTNEEKEFDIPSGVKTITDGAFENSDVEVITCPETIENIEKGALKGQNVRLVNFSDEIKAIDPEAMNSETLAVVYENTITKKALEANNFENIVSIEMAKASDTTPKLMRAASGRIQTTTGTRYAYTANYIRPAVLIRHNGTVVSNNSNDNDSNFTKKYTNNKYAGKATIVIAGKNKYKGLGRNVHFHIYYNSSNYAITLSNTSYNYNGKVNKPSVTVKTPDGKKASGYTVKYDNSSAVGTHTVSVVFNNDLDGKSSGIPHNSGTVYSYYIVYPAKPVLKKPKKGKKSFTVRWRQAKDISCYQIQYSTNKNFSNANTVTVYNAKATSKKIGKLKGKKRYYVRIRTYKNISGRYYYSPWSNRKSVKTKK